MFMNTKQAVAVLSLFAAILLSSGPLMAQSGSNKRNMVYFIADGPSHGYGEHDHKAGTTLLARKLDKNHPHLKTKVYTNGWPGGVKPFARAAAVVMYCDGGGGHVAMGHLDQLDQLTEQGVGIVNLHYAVEIPKGKPGDQFLKSVGGYFETHYSVNPYWTVKADDLPDHPITNGVEPFQIYDEWYYHMRFRDGMKNLLPVLADLPPKDTLLGRGWKPGKDSTPHHGNKYVWNSVVKKKQPQVTAWASKGPNGQRGFGFTGGHYHRNWAHDQVRKLVLNAITWAAHAKIPSNGITSKTPTVKELEMNHNEDGSMNEKKVKKLIEKWNGSN
jgi:type 1 glutamine amidotransferase